MPPSIFRKFFKRTSKNKDVKKDRVECDSVPIQNQSNLPAPIPIPGESLNAGNAHPGALTVPNEASLYRQGYPAVEVSNNHNSQTPSSYHSASSSTYSAHSSATPYIQLSVSNSHGFHIGDVQNVHVANGSVANFNSSPLQGVGNLEKSLSNLKTAPTGNNFDTLIRDFSKIKDWEISSISEYVALDWKKLGKHLEIGNSDLEAIEKQSDNSPQVAALEMFNFYLKNFPDTSYAFILHNLRETMHTKAVDQLIKLRS